MKNFNNKSRLEQVFLIAMLFVGCFLVLCCTGCGGSGNSAACRNIDEDGVKVCGYSCPGPGSCVTCKSGCGGCLCFETCKVIDGETEEGDEISAIDCHYYGGGCLGCGAEEQTKYYGCVEAGDNNDDEGGCFYGSTDDGETLINCSGCSDSHGAGRFLLDLMEAALGIG